MPPGISRSAGTDHPRASTHDIDCDRSSSTGCGSRNALGGTMSVGRRRGANQRSVRIETSTAIPIYGGRAEVRSAPC